MHLPSDMGVGFISPTLTFMQWNSAEKIFFKYLVEVMYPTVTVWHIKMKTKCSFYIIYFIFEDL